MTPRMDWDDPEARLDALFIPSSPMVSDVLGNRLPLVRGSPWGRGRNAPLLCRLGAGRGVADALWML